MPAPKVSVPYDEFLERCSRHDQVVAGLPMVDPKLQRLLAELVMMRLFDEFQEALAGIATRLACGVSYCDGSSPQLLTGAATSTLNARELFKVHNRAKPLYGLKWSKVKFINEATKHVLHSGDHFLVACSANSLVISEMQAVRNRIAHKNTNSRKAYSRVVLRHYGANLNTISPGLLLLSSRFTPTLLERYISSCRIIVRSCSRS